MSAQALPDSVADDTPRPLHWREYDGVIMVYDQETGEIIDVQRGFMVDNMGRLEWALGRIAKDEAEKLALEARKRALLVNLDAMIADVDRRLVGFRNRFDAEIESFARETLDGARTKTLKTPQGSVSFRIVPASHTIADMTAAVAWAEEHRPDAVRKLVTFSDLGSVYHDGPGGEAVEMADAPFIEKKGGGERMYLRTNVGRP